MVLAFLITGLWSFSEAILWFIVADVPISYIAVRHGWRAASLAAIVAALCALPGGAILYAWTSADPGRVHALIEALPGIDAAMIAETSRAYFEGGFNAMLAGSFGGTPYKLFAASAGASSPPDAWMAPFLLASFAVRVPRFLIVGLGVALVSRVLGTWLSIGQRLAVLGACWIAFYAWYFLVMPA